MAWLVQSCNVGAQVYEVACFIDDDEDKWGTVLNGTPVLSMDKAAHKYPDASVVIAVGNPRTRERLAAKASEAGFSFATLVHPRVERSQWIEMGEGTVICAGNILTTNISLGSHVQINLDCTIGHDVVMGDFTTLAPGVHVSGWVHMGRRVYVGTGAAIINGTEHAPLVIGDDAVVGAGAVVTRPVPPETTVVGVPAKPRK